MPHVTEIKVRGFHLDLYGHVNNARYLEFLEEARWGLLEGPALDWFMAQGMALVISRIDIRYHRSATMGDTLLIETRSARTEKRAAVVAQRVLRKRDGKLIAEAEVTVAVTQTGRAGALPMVGEIAERLRFSIDQ